MNILPNWMRLPGDNVRQIPCSCMGSLETAKTVLLDSQDRALLKAEVLQ